MTKDDVLFGYRCQIFDLAGRTTVTHTCRTFGIHRSTYYAWKAQVDRGGLAMLRPRERRAPQMPNQLSAIIEERIVAFAIAHPGLGPKRIASEFGARSGARSPSSQRRLQDAAAPRAGHARQAPEPRRGLPGAV